MVLKAERHFMAPESGFCCRLCGRWGNGCGMGGGGANRGKPGGTRTIHGVYWESSWPCLAAFDHFTQYTAQKNRDKLPPGQTLETVTRQQHGARQVFCCRAHMFHDRVVGLGDTWLDGPEEKSSSLDVKFSLELQSGV
ncbi:hypothetical protein EYF80_012187 [Liparis tanakae]|uniref:Uncharacterized protein n=1 Tax=Liparis tanakae TaxID=230148 RepID=A0A4Z2IIJ4_9TELE|nr:hypothetical protein EYF80_012187 [Liparis tanakae]